ncbi:efflux RND transporter periplasmic adaptor subunit [Roseivivax isoporae]|uniref:Hemolysin D n=1 Tax=Roseivivax isoporae LMG 25204 TaxID=1449351 RepID=X7F4G0_9RHOB|nr:HlyD family efflux transporter periplasmic adaptor subunit [Roseivivax isoporae]ETX27603.1 hemolysin D [Roseivivax isoporae LMG 25204]
MRFLRRSLGGLFMTALTLALLVWAAALVRDAIAVRLADDPPRPEGQERVFSVNVVLPEAETLRPVLTAYGEVRTRRELEIRAGTSGRIVALSPSMDEGGRVAAGEVLARIDPADAEAARDRARSDLEDAEAEGREARRAVTLARDNLDAAEEQAALYARALTRQRDLGERGVGSTSAVEDAELAAAAARATVIQRRQAVAEAEARVDRSATLRRRAAIAVEEAERALADTEIRADFAGVLSEVSVVEGRLVSENEQIARLIDPDALEVAFRVSTEGYARLLDGDGALRDAEVTVTLDVFGTDIVAEGRVDRAAGSVADGETGRVIYARLDRAPGFRPGDFVTVTVAEPPLSGVARLPATAMDPAGAVLAIGPEDRLEAVPVTLLRRQGDDILVVADAVAGRQVVAQRTPLLGAGIKVRAIGRAVPDELAATEAEADFVSLTEERRARLVSFVEGNERMPETARQRILAQLAEPQVPADVVRRIEARIGG